MNDNLKDGSILWDIWAFAAIILESDMDADVYKQVNSERESITKAQKHLERNGVCDHLKAIIRGTLLRGRIIEMISLDEILEHLKKV